ncbi:hypothetical protein N9R54_05455 [Pelobium sp.]|nr:hypothetical protein [Pelobium sp.]MDA9555665.1 hypothetical protein [Pelobium sp.]
MKDFSDIHVNTFKSLLGHVKAMSNSELNETKADYIIQILNDIIEFKSFIVAELEFPEIHRLTINRNILGTNLRIKNINLLKYPPKELVKSYGRCNLPNQSVLYASFGQLMIMSEMRPKVGDLITISTWKNIDNTPLKITPIFKNQPVNGTINLNSYNFNETYIKLLKQHPPNTVKEIDHLTQFIAEAFSKRFKMNSNYANYVISAYFSNQILNEYGDQVEAIFYPSVQQSLCFENLAIKPPIFDKKYKLNKVQESIVVKSMEDGDGGYFTEGVCETESFDYESSTIHWPNKYLQPPEKIKLYKELGYKFD